MGQAKQRGTQEQRITQAKARIDALRPENLVCGACKTDFTEFASMALERMVCVSRNGRTTEMKVAAAS
jgi:hypothetical protein